MSKPFELIMHMLCKHMQVMIKFNMWHNGMSTLFNRIFNLPFNIPNVFSTDMFVLDCIKFQCDLYLDTPSFSPLKGE
jgi:hypothetical protein